MTILEQQYYHAVIRLANSMSEVLATMNRIEKLMDAHLHKDGTATEVK